MVANITHEAWLKMQGFIDLCPDEISGLGKVEVREGEFYVTDIALFTQVVSPTHSDIPSKALAKFQVELIKKGENPKDWWCWWHSHAKMKPFFSGTDKATVENSTDFDMLLSIVSNHAHEFYAQFDMHRPVRLTQVVTVEVLEDENTAITEWCKEQYDSKVTRPTPVIHVPRVGYGRLLDDGDDWGMPAKQSKVTQRPQVDPDELAEYGAGLCAMQAELDDAKARKDWKLAKKLNSDIYDYRIDGYYAGLETLYPVKQI